MDKAVEAAQPKAPEGHALSAQVGDMQKEAQTQPASGAPKADAGHANDQAVKSGVLPQVSIQGAHLGVADAQAAKPAAAPEHHWWDTALTIGEDLGKGAIDEVVHHPLHLVENFAIGAAAAAVATVAAPEIGIAMAVGGVGLAAYGLYKNAGKWVHAAEDLNAPEGKSAAEIAQAHKTIQGVGAGATDIAAGVAGGFAGRAATLAIKGALAADTPVVNNGQQGETPSQEPTENTPNAPKDTHAIKNSAGASQANTNVNGDHGAGAAANSGATPGDGGTGHAAVAHHAATAGAASGDPTNGGDGLGTAAGGAPKALEVPKVEVPKAATAAEGAASDSAAADAAAAQEQALAASVKTNQGIFSAAADGQGDAAGVVPSGKQLYNVRFDRVTEEAGRRLFTLENPTEGVVVPKGAYIATRLDAAGNPVIENGMTNSWSMQGPKIAKTYNVDLEAVQGESTFVAPTRVDGPIVHMTRLTEPTTITTKWGPMSGKPGDWLANYDYDAAAGTPGNDYAIVTAESYKQTYQPKVTS